jgi:hypothetical protein
MCRRKSSSFLSFHALCCLSVGRPHKIDGDDKGRRKEKE